MLLVAWVYAPSLENGFIWDDDGYVQNNVALRSAAGLRDIWLRFDATPQYYPLVHTSFWIEHHLFGLAPVAYHATNLLLHALACLLLWRLLLRLAVPGAWLAAAVFAVHPVEVESVAWATERKNVLSLVFALGSLLAYLAACPPEAPPGTRPAPTRRYLLAWALYVCALFSKTVTASAPAVLLVIDWWKRGRIAWRDAAWLSPFFAVGLALASVTVRLERTHVGATGPDWDLSLAERVLVAGRAVWFYAGKLVWPHPLVFFYPRWRIDTGDPLQLALPLAVALVAAALWLLRGRIGRGPLAALLIFVGVLTPALGFFDVYPFRYSFVADHFQYHASAALIAGAAALAVLASARLGRRAAIAGLAALAVLTALGLAARRQVRVYRDLPTLYDSVIAADPGSWIAHNNLGKYLQNLSRNEEAIAHFRTALDASPSQPRIRNNLGNSLANLGRLSEASAELERAIASGGEIDDAADARVYLAVVRIRQERFAEAIGLLHEALRIRARDPLALYNLGVALGASGDLAGGAAALRESIALDPDSAMKRHELGAQLRALGDAPGAAAAFADASRLAPNDVAYRIDLGLALAQSGDLARAERELRSVVAAEPARADAANALGIVLARRGDLEAARSAFEAALRADPSHAEAAENLRLLPASAARAAEPGAAQR